MPRGKRRSKEEVRRIVNQLEASGQSVREFAKENQLAVSTLDLWRRKEQAAKKGATPQLRRVAMVGPQQAAEPFEIQIPEGPVLRVPATADLTSAESMVTVFLSACLR